MKSITLDELTRGFRPFAKRPGRLEYGGCMNCGVFHDWGDCDSGDVEFKRRVELVREWRKLHPEEEKEKKPEKKRATQVLTSPGGNKLRTRWTPES